MEKKIFSKFNVYDQIGYIIVGAIAIFVLLFNITYFYNYQIPKFNLDNFIIWLILAYFVGHLIQGISNLIKKIPIIKYIIYEDKDNFTKNQEEILNSASDFFSLKKQNNSKIWSLCYMLATAKDITGQVQAFNSYYSLYRGWTIIFSINSIFLLYQLILFFNISIFLLFLLNIFLGIIFYGRSKRFWGYLKDKVLYTFVIIKKLKL